MIDEPRASAHDTYPSEALLALAVPGSERCDGTRGAAAPGPQPRTDARRERGDPARLRLVSQGGEVPPNLAEAPSPGDHAAAVQRLATAAPSRLLPVVLALAATVRSSTQATEDLARLLNRVLEHLLGVGGPYRPPLVAETALAAARAHLGPGHPATLDALSNLAISSQAAGRATEALGIFERVLAERERLGAPDPAASRRVTSTAFFSDPGRTPRPVREDTSSARDLLALCLDRNGRLDVSMAVRLLAAEVPGGARPLAVGLADAIVSLTDATLDLMRLLNRVTAHLLGAGGAYRPTAAAESALAAISAHLGPEHPATLGARSNLAVAYQASGRAAEALVIFEEVLADRRRVLGREHPETLLALSYRSGAYPAEGRMAEALSGFEQVAADRARLLGPEHPATMVARTDLAACHHRAGRRAQALASFERVAGDCERLLGPDDPDTLNARTNLATAYQAAGRQAESLATFERVLADRVRLLGPDHPETLTARSELAQSYQAAGRSARALATFERVLADRQRLLGPEHPNTLSAVANLAVSYHSAGRTAEELLLLKRLAAGSERALGADHPKTLTARSRLAASYQSMGRPVEALNLLESVVADRNRLLGPEHPKALTARGNLAMAYQAVGRTAKALAILKQVVADCERVLGPRHPDTVVARANLAAATRRPAKP